MGLWKAIQSRRRQTLIQGHARSLRRCLARDYGASKTYTEGQVRTAMMKIRFPAQLLAAGYAAFVSRDDFSKLPDMPATYDVLRAEIRAEPAQGSREAWNPAPPTGQEGYNAHVS